MNTFSKNQKGQLGSHDYMKLFSLQTTRKLPKYSRNMITMQALGSICQHTVACLDYFTALFDLLSLYSAQWKGETLMCDEKISDKEKETGHAVSPGEAEENRGNSPSGQTIFGPRFEAGTSKICLESYPYLRILRGRSYV